jgi:hypothetical protein
MHCPRCAGLMREEQFFDLQRTQGMMWMRGWRCTACDRAIDPLLEANLRLRASTELATGLRIAQHTSTTKEGGHVQLRPAEKSTD